MKKTILIAASLALLASPAFTQESKTVGAAPADAKFSTVSKDEMFSSKLKGLNVYNQKDESIGEISDLAIKNHQIDAWVAPAMEAAKVMRHGDAATVAAGVVFDVTARDRQVAPIIDAIAAIPGVRK